MKVKYLRLTKNEKKEAKATFYQTETGTFVKKKLRTALICAILCVITSLYIIIEAFITDKPLWDKIYGFSILIIGIIFLIMHRKIYVKKVNDFITRKKK